MTGTVPLVAPAADDLVGVVASVVGTAPAGTAPIASAEQASAEQTPAPTSLPR